MEWMKLGVCRKRMDGAGKCMGKEWMMLGLCGKRMDGAGKWMGKEWMLLGSVWEENGWCMEVYGKGVDDAGTV
jgi:hypothetical protein